jgi:dynein heavy chain
MDGLEDQLLANVVTAERPDVEEKNVKLMLSMSADKKKLQEIQDNILKMLSESKGNILDDGVLINTLADSKVTGEIIQERVVESQKTSAEIEETRSSYQSVATRASLLYFVIADMGNVDTMYQYSLEYYAALFVTCLHTAPAATELEVRLANLVSFTTEIMYVNICRGLFEKDKLLYASLICGAVVKHDGRLSHTRWDLLLKGPGPANREEQRQNPHPDEISEFVWDMLEACELRVKDATSPAVESEETVKEFVRPFDGLLESLCTEWELWQAWVDSHDPLHHSLPEKFSHLCKVSKPQV